MSTKGQMIVEAIKRIEAEQATEEARNPLAAYSTRQLKAELKRRDRQRLQLPADCSDKYNFPRKIFT